MPSPGNRKNWQWVANFESDKSIEKLTIPVLVLLGGKDPLTPTRRTTRAWRESLSPDIPGNQVHVFKNAGHGLRTGGHGGDYIDGFFRVQIDWLISIGMLEIIAGSDASGTKLSVVSVTRSSPPGPDNDQLDFQRHSRSPGSTVAHHLWPVSRRSRTAITRIPCSLHNPWD